MVKGLVQSHTAGQKVPRALSASALTNKQTAVARQPQPPCGLCQESRAAPQGKRSGKSAGVIPWDAWGGAEEAGRGRGCFAHTKKTAMTQRRMCSQSIEQNGPNFR